MQIPTLILSFLVQFSLTNTVNAHPPSREAKYVTLPSLRDQAKMQDSWTTERLSHIPTILHKHNVSAWLMSQHEHTEDTIFWSLKSATQFSARRRTIDLFLASPSSGSPCRHSWIDNTPGVWDSVLSVLEKEDPETIVVNVDADVAFSAGLHVGEMEEMQKRLGRKWVDRFVRVPMVGVEFVAWMGGGGKEKLGWYRKLMETAWAAIREAFSERVITPGVTSTEDVEWWLRDKIQALNYTTWFHPSVSIVTTDSDIGRTSSFFPSSLSPPSALDLVPNTIQHGNLLHVDFGVTALGMNTDTQHLAYVLPPGATSSSVPPGLRAGLAKANRLQDILLSHMRPNLSPPLTGNAILSAALVQMRTEGFNGSIYSHPIGDWGHSAGALIGMTNLQDGVPVLGELELLKDTWYSIELYGEHFVEEWNGTWCFYLEEDVYWDEGKGGFEWVWGRQEEFHLIRSDAVNEGNEGSEGKVDL